MTDLTRKRDFVANLYEGEFWKRRVKRMSDEQIVAIYLKEQKNPVDPKQDSEQQQQGPDQDDQLEIPL
jgi:hypothetical protein